MSCPRRSRRARPAPTIRSGRRSRCARSRPARAYPRLAARALPDGLGLPVRGEVLDAPQYQRGPAGLVAGPDSPAVIAMEVFVEQHQVLPVRVGGPARIGPMAGPPARAVG